MATVVSNVTFAGAAALAATFLIACADGIAIR